MHDYTFRLATSEDKWDVFKWRNSEKVRAAMLTQHEISKDEHSAWWDRKLNDVTFRILLLEDSDSVKAVQIFFDINATKDAWWAFYFTPNAPEDMGTMLNFWKVTELAGLTFAFEHLKLQNLICEVLKSNPGVLNWHKRFGFEIQDQSLSDNTGSYDLEVLAMTREVFSEKIQKKWSSDIQKIAFP